MKKARLDINLDLNETHNQRIVNTGGVAMAYKAEELIPLINKELSIPEKRLEGRRTIVSNEAGPIHGVAGKSIAEIILNC